MYGLSIHLKSFKLNPNLVKGNDKVRVSITTFPEQMKEAFIIEAKQTNSAYHFFTVNITDQTQKIVFVFRKISLFQKNPIIASTVIYSKDLPSFRNKNNREMRIMRIFEPVSKGHQIRQIFGEMQIQFTLTSAFPTFQNSKIIENSQQIKRNSKNLDYYNNIDENPYVMNSIFIDDVHN